jgi:hypothetical protein
MVLDQLVFSTAAIYFGIRASFEQQSVREFCTVLPEEHVQIAFEMLEVEIRSSF